MSSSVRHRDRFPIRRGSRLPSTIRRGQKQPAVMAAICVLTACALLCGPAPALLAQQAASRFASYTPSEGLSNSTVTAIWQDRDGFLWFGTEDGLNRFDGHHFTPYRADAATADALSDNWITAITEDAAGNLWIGTRNQGLSRFDRRTRTFTRYAYATENPAAGLRSGTVGAVLVDREGMVWVGTGRGGLSRLDPAAGTFSHYGRVAEDSTGLLSHTIWCLYEDRAGDLWIGTWSEGLSRLSRETGTFQHYQSDPDDPHTLSSNRVRSIFEDREGNLWIGTSGGGLNRLDRRTGTFTRYLHAADDPFSLSHNTVWTVFEDSREDLWVGTFGGGLNKFDRSTATFTRYVHRPSDPSSLPSNVVLSIFEDRSGLLWLGTDNGVVKYNPASEHIVHFRQDRAGSGSLGHDDVLAIAQSSHAPGTFWVGTNRGGLSRLNLETGQITTFRHDAADARSLSHDVVSAVCEDASGLVWVGTKGGGLNAYDPQSRTFKHFRHDPSDSTSLSHDVVFSLLVDRAGDLWVGTDGRGINRLNRAEGTFQRYAYRASDSTGIVHNSVTVLYEGADGSIWVGTTDAGLHRFDPRHEVFTRYRSVADDPRSLSHNRVHAIYEDTDGTLWVGTYNGLNRFDPRREVFTRYTVQDGLIGSVIYGLIGGPDGSLWITTNRGISKYDPRTGRFANYGQAEGSRDTHFNPGAIAQSPSGEILVGGANGLTVVPPKALPQKPYRPRLVVTAFKKFGALAEADLWGDKPVRLTHDDRHFSFEFALLDYTNPPEHTFRYRLEGFDAGWQELNGSVGQAHYANHEGRVGSFVFRIQGVDSKGRSAGLSVPVMILPPWWRTRWFRVLSLLGTVLFLSTAVVYRHWRKQQELSEKRRMLSESREQERHFLARELHDMPLQNLYSVRHKLEVFARSIPANGQTYALEEAQRMLDRTSEDLRRICGELRPPTLSPFGLSKAIRAHLRTFEQVHPEICVEFDLAPDGQRLPESMRLALFRIYQGALSNVVRHARARHVWIRFKVDDHQAVLEVQDDGKGFSVPRSWLELARQGHYGLLGIAEWADAAGGHLMVRSAPGEGALLQVRVPLGSRRRQRVVRSSLSRLGGLVRRHRP